jgi:hypothetical protein
MIEYKFSNLFDRNPNFLLSHSNYIIFSQENQILSQTEIIKLIYNSFTFYSFFNDKMLTLLKTIVFSKTFMLLRLKF